MAIHVLQITKWPRYSSTITLTDTRLAQEWSRLSSTGTRSFLLNTLSDQLGYERAIPPTGKKYFFRAAISFIGGILFYDSQVHQLIPLLTPLLYTVAVGYIVGGLPFFRIEEWSIVQLRNGSPAMYIVHSGCTPDKRKTFETAFSEAVRQSYAIKHNETPSTSE
jgi:hypothetical protein